MPFALAMRLLFLGTPTFAIPVLARLLEAGHQVAGVVTRPDRPAGRGRRPNPQPVKAYAEEHALIVLQPPSLRRPEAVEWVASLRPEVVVVAAYGRILPPEVLALPPKGVLNLHPSLAGMYQKNDPKTANR